jgi:DNA-binding transcriptional ArsR family regulator
MMSLNDTFKALSDPTRRKILDLLQQKDMTAGDISEQFQMTKPAISHHLNLLKQADLVSDERKGQHIYYSINATLFQDLLKWVLHFDKKKGDE